MSARAALLAPLLAGSGTMTSVRGMVLIGVLAGCGRLNFEPVGSRDGLDGLDAPAAWPLCTPQLRTTRLVTDDAATRVAIAGVGAGVGVAYYAPAQARIVFLEATTSALVSSGPIVSATGGSSGVSHSIAWSGTEFAVLRRMSTPSTSTVAPVILSRYGTGAALDTTISTMGMMGGGVDVGSDGATLGAGWAAFGLAELGAWFAPIGADGVRSVAGAAIGGSGDCACTPAIAWSGTEWLSVVSNDILGADRYGIGLTRLTADGTPVEPIKLVSEPLVHALNPDIAANPSTIAISWDDGTNFTLTFSSFDRDGVFRTASTQATPGYGSPLLTTHGRGFAAVWTADAGIQLAAFDGAFAPLGEPVTVPGSEAATDVAVTSTGSELVIAWIANGDINLSALGCDW